ncbi:hypothetical protein J0S82_010976 [Galemys pyrenaicus]|uniref:Uncharacterized protein n=1 Tax=Galemys pyrenaicus TaxID=202257 RepID=A0A8J6AFN8_GALPY|nr:hypothetical protein J0S82_010976 [Galemys pyrenaicus]
MPQDVLLHTPGQRQTKEPGKHRSVHCRVAACLPRHGKLEAVEGGQARPVHPDSGGPSAHLLGQRRACTPAPAPVRLREQAAPETLEELEFRAGVQGTAPPRPLPTPLQAAAGAQLTICCSVLTHVHAGLSSDLQLRERRLPAQLRGHGRGPRLRLPPEVRPPRRWPDLHR